MIKGIEADSYLAMGSSHTVCEDYCIASQDGSYAIVGDGCSGQTDTDVGARLLVLAKAKQMNAKSDRSIIQRVNSRKAIISAARAADAVGINRDCLYSTLLPLGFDEKSGFNTRIFGDGVVAARDRETHNIHVVDIDYLSGAPKYPAYDLDYKNKRRWSEEYGETLRTRVHVVSGKDDYHSLGHYDHINHWPVLNWNWEQFDIVAVMSDGVKTFRDLVSHEPVNFKDVIWDIFQFKTMRGAFLARRLHRYLKEQEEYGVTHYDDFSMAAIHVEADDEPFC